MREAVIIAEGDQGQELEPHVGFGIVQEAIAQGGGIFSLNHEHGFFEQNVPRSVYKCRHRVQAELAQVAVAVRMYRTWILVGREIVDGIPDPESLLDLAEENRASHRGARGRHQKTVVAARVHPGYCRGSEAANPVGLQPFLAPRLRQVRANILVKLHLLFAFLCVFASWRFLTVLRLRRTP